MANGLQLLMPTVCRMIRELQLLDCIVHTGVKQGPPLSLVTWHGYSCSESSRRGSNTHLQELVKVYCSRFVNVNLINHELHVFKACAHTQQLQQLVDLETIP
eukprot:GHUV01018669.1.p1 GENE.GHUV01018669.1~~GHUV01018669.1.p1  ORF type:complete len:102 (+),score=30.77 GHUV01018669.1:1597-1902(+)